MTTEHKRRAACAAVGFALAIALAAPPAAATAAPVASRGAVAVDQGLSPAQIAAPGAKKPNPPRDPAKTNVLVNKRHPLVPRKFVPRLSAVPGTGISLQPPAAKAYKRLAAAARRDGVNIKLTSGYRSHARQQELLRQYTRAYGSAYAKRIVALPGTSEHQTGLAIDVGNHSRACALQPCFAGTKVGAWMARNAPAHGFILRYPWGMEKVTGYLYEPWHFRYVGPAQAKSIKRAKAKTLEHYYGVASAPKPTSARPAPVETPAATGTRRTTANLNLRRGPALGEAIIKTVPRGSAVSLTGKKSGSWVQARHGGSTGWMSAAYLR